MSTSIKVTLNGKIIPAVVGLTLSEITKGEKPCGGHGRCGKCKVIATGVLSEPSAAELTLLSEDEQAAHVRLACMTRAMGDCEIRTLDTAAQVQIVTDGTLPAHEAAPSFSGYGVALDIGTTTLAARLYDTAGNLLAEASALNPQQKWGADVISRIEAALGDHAHALADAIRQALNALMTELADTARIAKQKIDGVVITGNSVMLSLLTEESVEPFSHAPFDARRLFGETLTAAELGLSGLHADAEVYLPPCISAFVGADTVCALLSTQICNATQTAMLADIGTNGEMALWHNGSLTVCSTAAGPAFEGVGISMGMRGAVGAIDRVALRDGVMQAHTVGEGTPIGICGSGLVDAVACLLESEVLDETGYLEDDPITVSEPVVLTQQDIRMVQLAKSAICAGLSTLLQRAGVGVDAVETLSIAGGFGKYLNMKHAGRIGLIPEALTHRFKVVGNAALTGAALLLLDRNTRREAARLAQDAVVRDLASDPVFADLYMMGMMFESDTAL